MESQSDALPFLREILLFLALAGVLIPLLQRLRVNQVLGFLGVGVLLGPFGLALWDNDYPWLSTFTFPKQEGVTALGDLGVLFLMFMIGLELSIERLWALRRWVLGAGMAQVLGSALLIGGVALVFGNPWQVAVVLGLVLSLSSTAVVMQLLTQRQALGSPVGQSVFSVLMLQDLAVVPLLILVGLLSPDAPPKPVQLVLVTLVKSVVAVSLIVLAGRTLIQPLFRFLARQHQPDVFMALTLLATLSIAALTSLAGLSMALGALLAGLLLAETEYRHEVEVTVEPFKGLLMGLFFMSVGMGLDVREVGANPVWVPVSVVGLIALKGGVVTLIFRRGGLTWGQALEAGLLLGQGGEFAFIVVGVATGSGVLPHPLAQFMLLVVGLSLFVTPLLGRLGPRLGSWLDERLAPQATQAPPRAPEAVPNDHVIIAGFGRVGELMAQVLREQGVPFVAVEQDAQNVKRARSRNFPVHFGNATRPELLRKLQAGSAAAVVITMDQPAAALQTVKAIRHEYPELPIFARSRDERHARDLLDAGATTVIPETLEAGLQLAGFVLQGLGVSDGAATRLVDRERQRRLQRMSPS